MGQLAGGWRGHRRDGTGQRCAEFLHASMLDFVTGWDVMSKKLIIGLLLGICFWIGLGLLAYLVLL